MSEVFPLAVAVLVVVLVAMPWSRLHPNHDFVLELLRSRLGDEQAVPRSGRVTWAKS